MADGDSSEKRASDERISLIWIGRPRALLVAMFVAVAWAAASFATAGLLAVVLDRDPIESATGQFYGILALVVAGVLVWLAVGFTVGSRRPWVGTLAVTAGVYLVFVVSGFLIATPLLVEQATSPFVLASAVLAGIAVAATWGVLRPRTGPRRPS